jgi:hypothetical protein
MDLVQRAKNIVLSPNTEWPVIAVEPASTGELIAGYALPLAAIGAVAGFIGTTLVGTTIPLVGTYRASMMSGLVGACITLVSAVIGIFILTIIINALAPTFGGQQNSTQAMKVAVYSYTPAWLAGALQIVPLLGLLAIIAGLYSLYVLYLGLPVLMKNPPDKSVAYTVVVVICAIVLAVIFGVITTAIVGVGAFGSRALSGTMIGQPAASSNVTFDKNSPLGKLQELGNKLDENNKKIDAAQKSGDQAGAAAAAMSGLGILMGGGHRYEAVDIDTLKPLVPATFAGMPQTPGSSSAEKNGFAGLMVSEAKASYHDGNRSADLEITDTGGASGLVGLAGWAGGIEGEKEDSEAIERTSKQNGRLVHERTSKTGGTNELDVVVGDRFVVKAEGRGGVDLNQLKSAVSALDLGKLESMKEAGVQK